MCTTFVRETKSSFFDIKPKNCVENTVLLLLWYSSLLVYVMMTIHYFINKRTTPLPIEFGNCNLILLTHYKYLTVIYFNVT